jgi:hypothetical protein
MVAGDFAVTFADASQPYQ